ncbi:MAG: DUF4397 domain-containing protein [Bacteroidia bacterium]|nr:DUF4397 domain-containing protein [Bacteroidia bacterium]
MNTRKILAMMAIAMISMVSFSSCKDDDDDNASPSTSNKGSLMFVHTSPDAPGVDVLLNGNKLNQTNLEYAGFAGYFSVNPATYNVKINPAGTSVSVIDADITVAAKTAYSVFAVDSVSNISPLVLTDDLTTPAAGKAHVRFIHLSPDAPAVDVALAGGAVVFGNKSFKEFTAFTPLDAATYNLEVRLAGTSTVVLPLPNISLTAGKIYTVYAKGFVSGAGTQALGAGLIVNN